MNDYLKALNETFTPEGALTPEKLMAFSSATLRFFQEIQGRLASEDPEVKENATKEAAEMKTALEEKVKALCAQWGIDPEQLNQMMPDPALFAGGNPDKIKQMTESFQKTSRKEEKLPPFNMKA